MPAGAGLRSGEQFTIGDLTFRCILVAAPAAAGSYANTTESRPMSHPPESMASDDHADEPDIEDVVAFSLRPTAVEPSAGEKRRAPVLEVHHMWGNVLLDSRQSMPEHKILARIDGSAAAIAPFENSRPWTS